MVFAHGDAMRRAGTARRIGVVGGLLICALMTLVGASARAHVPPQVSAVDARGRALPVNPAMQIGEEAIVTARGFAPRARVTVAIAKIRTLAKLRARVTGELTYSFVVPRSIGPGRHALLFVGVHPNSGNGPAVHASPSRPRKARTPIVARVPLVVRWPFRVVGRHGPVGAQPSPGHSAVGGTAAHHPAGTAGGAGHTPASTGIDLRPLLVVGGAAVVLGGAALVVGRGRRRH